jgi:hypothetical protein
MVREAELPSRGIDGGGGDMVRSTCPGAIFTEFQNGRAANGTANGRTCPAPHAGCPGEQVALFYLLAYRRPTYACREYDAAASAEILGLMDDIRRYYLHAYELRRLALP